MSWLSEDPTIPVGALLLLAAGFLIALRVTQRGEFLVRAGVALGLALAILAVEWLWVTDGERIEAVVYDLARAIESRDADRALGHFAPSARLVMNARSLGVSSLGVPLPRETIRRAIEGTQFDMLRVRKLTTNAGAESRRGSAEFQVVSSGSVDTDGPTLNFAATDAAWSLGFVEAEPGVWKVNRITPVRLPRGSEQFIIRSLGG